MVPPPAVSLSVGGRDFYEQPMPFQSPSGDFETERVIKCPGPASASPLLCSVRLCERCSSNEHRKCYCSPVLDVLDVLIHT